jgi:hypothetical protein
MKRQGIEALDLFIEQDTDRTPDDKRVYVFAGGVVVGVWRRWADAFVQYQGLRDAAGYAPPKPVTVDASARSREAQDEYVRRSELNWTAFRWARAKAGGRGR